jgi:hypothetical protein
MCALIQIPPQFNLHMHWCIWMSIHGHAHPACQWVCTSDSCFCIEQKKMQQNAKGNMTAQVKHHLLQLKWSNDLAAWLTDWGKEFQSPSGAIIYPYLKNWTSIVLEKGTPAKTPSGARSIIKANEIWSVNRKPINVLSKTSLQQVNNCSKANWHSLDRNVNLFMNSTNLLELNTQGKTIRKLAHRRNRAPKTSKIWNVWSKVTNYISYSSNFNAYTQH